MWLYDFLIFYNSGKAILAGQSLSQELSTPNLNLVLIAQWILLGLIPHFWDLFCLNRLRTIIRSTSRFSGAFPILTPL
jgi:hypothetical protein